MTAPPRVVYVAGAGHSGTSTLAEVLREFGLHVPGPEADTDTAHPRGRNESRWVVDLHTRMLRSAGVHMTDDRPIAWHLVDRAGAEGNVSAEIREWLTARTAEHSALVLKDPRLLWFLEHWQDAATSTGTTASCITMLRPPTQTVGSGPVPDQDQEPVDRVAGWINMMLGTELATRATPRAFVRHSDLIHDWDGPVFDAAAALDLPMIDPDNLAAVERVDALIDPTTPRSAVTWDDIPVPAALRGLADDTWAALDALPEHDDAGTRAEFDRLRALYPYVHRKTVGSPARRIARMMPSEVVPPAVRQGVTGMLWRSSPAARWPARRGSHMAR